MYFNNPFMTIGAPASPRPPSGRKPTSPRPGSGRYSRPSTRGASRPGSGFVNVPKKAEISVTDSGRKADMPTCPVMFVMGKQSILFIWTNIQTRFHVTVIALDFRIQYINKRICRVHAYVAPVVMATFSRAVEHDS